MEPQVLQCMRRINDGLEAVNDLIGQFERQASPSAAILGGYYSEPHYSPEEADELAARMELDELIDQGAWILEPSVSPDVWDVEGPDPETANSTGRWI